MGNCCTGSPTTDHPFTPDHSLPPLHAAFANSSPQLGGTNSVSTGAGAAESDPVIRMGLYSTAGAAGQGSSVLDATDSVAVRSPDTVVHMADREGVCVCVCACACVCVCVCACVCVCVRVCEGFLVKE